MQQYNREIKPETISELYKRHLQDKSHIISNEEFQNAVILLPETSLGNDSPILPLATDDNQ